MMKKMKQPITLEVIAAKFLANLPIRPVDKNICWVWQGTLAKKGYGELLIGSARNRKSPYAYRERAHRFAYCYFNKTEIPEGLHVLHKCDNPQCCNPSHLFLGTNLDNIADKMRKGRQFQGPNPNMSRGNGTQIYNAKLTEDDVQKICELHRAGYSYRKIAKQFKVSTSPIYRVLSGKGWKHVSRDGGI